MTKATGLILTIALTLGLGTFVLAQGMDKMMHGAHGTAAKPGDTASTKAFKDVHMKMMQDMTISYTGDSDVDFVRGMIPHHQGAIDMAKIQLQHGKDPALRKMAETIIADQQREIAEMNGWLKKNAK